MHSKKTTWKNSLTLNGERKCFHITCFLRLRQPQPWWNTTPTLMKHNPNLDGTQHCMSMSLHVFFATFGRYEPLGHAPRDVNRMPTDSLYSHLILKALVYLTSSLLRTNKKPRKKTPAHQPHHTNPPFPPFPPKKTGQILRQLPGQKSFARKRVHLPPRPLVDPRYGVLTTKSLIPSSAILSDNQQVRSIEKRNGAFRASNRSGSRLQFPISKG